MTWINGYGNGVTGPTTPAIGGVTVEEEYQKDRWYDKPNTFPYPYDYHTVVSEGMEVIAIIPTLPGDGGKGKRNAQLISAAPDLLEACEAALKIMEILGGPETAKIWLENAIKKAKGE